MGGLFHHDSLFSLLFYIIAKLNDITTFNAGDDEDDILFDEEFEDESDEDADN